MPLWTMPAFVSALIGDLAVRLDRCTQPRFWSVFFGVLVCRERRRTASAWFRAAGIGTEFRRAYDLLGSVGRRIDVAEQDDVVGNRARRGRPVGPGRIRVG